MLVSVQKAQFGVRACKIPGFMRRLIGPTVRICGNSGLPFAMVPRLHQSIHYIKRKIREWRAEKCNPCFGAKSPVQATGLQRTRFHAVSYRADSANMRKFGASFRHGTAESSGVLRGVSACLVSGLTFHALEINCMIVSYNSSLWTLSLQKRLILYASEIG